MLVNKRELAPLLGVTIPTVDRWLRMWPEFPVTERGGPGQPWGFDPEAAQAFVAGKREAADHAKLERSERLAQFALPLFDGAEPPVAAGARSAGELLALARLRRLQREEAIAAGRLVDARRAAETLAAVFGRLGRDLRAGLRRIVAAHGIPADAAAEIEAAFAEQQRAAVRRLQADLGGEILPAPEGAEAPAERPELRLVVG